MSTDSRTTAQLIAAAYPEDNEDAYWTLIREIHVRGGQAEFQAARTLAQSTDAVERQIGADILGQLGAGKPRFHEESVNLLITLLADTEASVIASAAFSLGHRGDARAVPHLLPHIKHSSAWVRQGVAHGLMGHDDPAAVTGLITLSADSDFDTRNWATFALGSQCEADTPALRAALRARLDEEDAEIRGEALIGLARCQDRSIQEHLLAELNGEFHGSWALQAAELLADPVYHPALFALRQRIAEEEDEYFLEDADAALAACRPMGKQDSAK